MWYNSVLHYKFRTNPHCMPNNIGYEEQLMSVILFDINLHTVTIFGVRVVKSQGEILFDDEIFISRRNSWVNKHLQQR